MSYKGLNINQVTWEDVRDRIEPHNKHLVDVIDQLCPSKDLRLFTTKYKFGDKPLQRGVFHLPTESGDLVPLSSDAVPEEIKSSFYYCGHTVPVMVVLKRQLELFVDFQTRIAPFLLIQPGNMYGVWKVLDQMHATHTTEISHAPYNVWDMTAGSRSMFCLPKISENISHTKLQKKYKFSYDKPKEYRDHWEVFKRLYESEQFEETWETEILLFSGDWFKYLNDPAWKDFRLYLLDFNWKCSEYWRNQFIWRMTFAEIHKMLNINPPPFYVDTVNHLLAIGIGALPGFSPVLNDNFAPASRLQEIYINDYNSKWAPIMMQPKQFDMNEQSEGVYYSLQFPTSIELSPKNSKRTSAVNDAYAICSLLEKYRRELLKGNFGIDDLPLTELCKKVSFEFYHEDNAEYPKLSHTDEVYKDPRFYEIVQKMGYKEIPLNSSFFKGCVKIHTKN